MVRRDGSCPCSAIGLHFDSWHGPDDNYRDTETDIINENRTRLVPLLGWPRPYFLNNWKSVLAFI